MDWENVMALFHFASTSVVALFLFVIWVSRLRDVMRRYAYAWARKHVEDGIQWVIFAQKFKSPWLTSLFVQASHSVSVGFYGTILPILIWSGFPELGIHLVLLMAFTLYIGNAMKDLVGSPRPLGCGKGREKLDFLGNGSEETLLNANEYGLPSSHTMNSLCLNFYIVHYFKETGLLTGSLAIVEYAVAVVWVAVIAASRIYLGLHTPVDVYVGAATGVMVFFTFIGFEKSIKEFCLLSFLEILARVVCVAGLFLKLHPMPPSPTPSFEFTTSFMGVMVGVMSAVGLNKDYVLIKPKRISLFSSPWVWYFRRLIVGFAVVLFLKTVLKTCARFFLTLFFDLFPVSIRQLWQPPVHSTCPINKIRNIRLKSLPHSESGNPKDVDIGARFVSYAGLGFGVCYVAPWVFSLFDW